MLSSLKSSRSLKRFVRWAVWGATVFFIAETLRANWPEVMAIDLTPMSWRYLALAWLLSLLAHSWAGWVWHWLLRAWGLPLGGLWAVRVYLFTNVAKYLPGNIWHFYGRVRAVRRAGGSFGQAIASVVAEPLVMAVAAVGLGAIASAIFCFTDLRNLTNQVGSGPLWTLGLTAVWIIALLLLHPRWLNPRLAQMSRLKLNRLKLGGFADKELPSTVKMKADAGNSSAFVAEEGPPALRLKRYPLRPLLGEMGFVLWRSLGFIVTLTALMPIGITDWPLLISTFSIAWLLGLVVPGAPGGIGVFEASAIALLGGQFPHGIVLGSVACYRLVSTLAEVVGAAIAWLYEQKF